MTTKPNDKTTELKQAFEKWQQSDDYYNWNTTDQHAELNFSAGFEAGRSAAHGEQTDYHGDGLGLALFIVHSPGMEPRIGRPRENIAESLRGWYHANPGAEIYVLRTWSDAVGCQSIENGRTILQMEGDDLPSQACSAEQSEQSASEMLRRVLEWPNPNGTIEDAYLPPWLAKEARAALSAQGQQSEDAK